jgi:hypothetical protein
MIRRTLPATAATWGTALLMVPIAAWRHGVAGIAVVAAAALATTLAGWLAAWLERNLAAGGHTLAGLLAPSGVRMILPLAFALVIATWGQTYVSPQVLLFIVPLYLAMLVVETTVAIQHGEGSNWPASEVSRPLDSASYEQG